MRSRALICLMAVLFAYDYAFSQPNYNSITVCHDKNKHLRSISIGKYDVKVQEAELYSFTTKDSSVQYDAINQLFVVKNAFDTSLLRIRLTATGVVASARDSSIVLDKLSELRGNTIITTVTFRPEGSNIDMVSDPSGVCNIGNFSLAIAYKGDRIGWINVPLLHQTLSIILQNTNGIYSWQVSISEKNDIHKLELESVNNFNYKLKIYDDNNSVGVWLAGNRKGFFDTVHSYTKDRQGIPVQNLYFKLEYDKDGKLKTKHTEFNLECISE